jgi:uncharacterized RDD family membrane protein YckC
MSYINDAELNPYAAPKTVQAGYAHASLGYVEYGGFWARVGATFIDFLVLCGIGIIFGTLLVLFMTVPSLDPTIPVLLTGLGWWMAQICYAPLMLSSERQATIGKSAMGLKVVDGEGRRVSFLRALGREFAKTLSSLVFMVGFLMVAFTERKQGLHDMIAGTLVVKAR